MGATRNAYCSFCRKDYQTVGPLVEGPGNVYICRECIELCQSIVDQEVWRRSKAQPTAYVELLAERVVRMAEDYRALFHPQFEKLMSPQSKPNPDALKSIIELSTANAALEIVSQIVRKLSAMGLEVQEKRALDTLVANLEQLKTALATRAINVMSE